MNEENNYLLLITEFLPTLEKYSNIEVKDLGIEVTKYDDGVVLKIRSSTPEVADALAEVMLMIPKICKTDDVDIKVDSKNLRSK